ncbi:enoyl-CoA hydratase/isomerase family protein [Rhodosalinus sediminis]|uniref:enoyl-CoA hydratase/isomerase family protein n=1 Tax=Rhodosalinus sediminis TaxID=1940533 RepID=UPI0023569449|nr:enoyl-CoA hydratase/isomerase family protein [Rhodosalinus sediminis]
MTNGQAMLHLEGPVARIVVSNPDAGYMDRTMEDALLDAVARVEADPAVRVCVLSGGTPGVFIRHYDLKALAPQARSMAARGMTFSMDRPVKEAPIHRALRLMEEGTTVHVAALNGTAMGGGFELALACDLRVVEAGDHAFGLPEINLGLLPGAGGTQRLPTLVGLSRALQMTLTGDTLTPQEMVASGLALDGGADAVAAARTLAARLAAKPARALAHIKRLTRRGVTGDAEGFALERTLFCDLMTTPEAGALLDEGAAGRRRITDEP